jgi:hypothetical protein
MSGIHQGPSWEDFMSNALSDVEIQRQDVELLPARTVLSLVCHASCGNTTSTSPTGTSPSTASTTATPTAASTTGTPSSGAPSSGGPTFTANNIFVFLATTQYNTVTGGAGGASGASGTGAAGTSAAGMTSAS